MERTLSWSAAWGIARRDLHARFRGLRLLLVCLFLGVGALSAIGTLTGAIGGEIDNRGRELLGGDLQAEIWQRDATEEERAAFAEYGEVSSGYRLQAMARKGEQASPIGLKAVDAKWPLVGEFTLSDGTVAGAPASDQAWLAKGAADRLDAKVGDTIQIGTETLTVGGIIGNEPDRLSEGFSLGATIIVAEDLPAKAGLLAPGSLYRSKYRIDFDGAPELEATVEELEARFPNAGFEYRSRERASPGVDRFVTRMGEFLTLVGLAALVIAGIGIGGGVSSYLEARRNSIATLKILGATSKDIGRIYLLQLGAAALAGSLAGLAAGVLVTPALGAALQGLLPVESGFVFDGWALVRAAAFGLLVALVFAAPPLVRARQFPAMALMRSGVTPLAKQWRGALPLVVTGLIGIVLLATIGTREPLMGLSFLAGAAVVFGLLALLGWIIRQAAAKAPRPKAPLLRQAIANIHRPGAPTGQLVTALGFGLAAFVLLAAIQTAIDRNIEATVPNEAPDYFVLDIPRDKEDAFRELVTKDDPEAMIRTVPALRGRILAYGAPDNMTRVADLEELPEGAWPLRGERGLTYSPDVPEGNVVTEGDWWASDHSGESLVSVDEELAQAIDLKVGDAITIGVLGTERTATVANLRRIDWENMGFNYVLVFSPNTLADTPHNLAATIDLTEGSDTAPLLQALVREFPSSSAIEIGQVLDEAQTILGQVGLAVLAAASVAVLAGIAVLLGAIAAARERRTYDTVIFRVLGASRKQVWLVLLAEFLLLALILSFVALLLGGGIAWAIVTQMFEFEWLPNWPVVLGVLGAGIALVLAFALAGSAPVLRAKPAQALREL